MWGSRHPRPSPKILRPHRRGPYLAVHLRRHETGGYADRFVHRLVIEAWVGPQPARGYVVRHLNGDPTDNRVENLAWGSARDNSADRLLHDGLTRADVFAAVLCYLRGADIQELERVFGVNEGRLKMWVSHHRDEVISLQERSLAAVDGIRQAFTNETCSRNANGSGT